MTTQFNYRQEEQRLAAEAIERIAVRGTAYASDSTAMPALIDTKPAAKEVGAIVDFKPSPEAAAAKQAAVLAGFAQEDAILGINANTPRKTRQALLGEKMPAYAKPTSSMDARAARRAERKAAIAAPAPGA